MEKEETKRANVENNGKKLILVVEDDSFLASIQKSKLEKEGFEVVLANNGVEALSFMKKRKPDLILLDLIMPIMDGFETLKTLKADPDFKHIKVVIPSNLSQEDDRKKVLELGAEEYIVKANLSFRQTIEKVRKYSGL